MRSQIIQPEFFPVVNAAWHPPVAGDQPAGGGADAGGPAALDPVQQEIAQLERRKQEILREAPQVLVAMAGQPRTVRILPRGNWLDETGQIVQPAEATAAAK